MGIADYSGHSRQHRTCDVVFRKTESGVCLVDNLLQLCRQDINGETADNLRSRLLCNQAVSR